MIKTETNILQAANAAQNCIKANNPEWEQKHREQIIEVLLDKLPHGSGIDCDWTFEINEKTIVGYNSYHRMDDNGFYCEYIDFSISIRTEYRDMFGKLIIGIGGRFGRHQDIKDYLYEIIAYSLENC